jgi:AcrR family transcriptional regulator
MAIVNHKERHRLIVEKALELFARMGYAKVSFLAIS